MNDLVHYQHGARFHARAAHDAKYYTLAQLKQFYSTASLGFLCASFASWALMAFFIGQFFAGAEFESMHEWRAIQFVYAAMGIALATAITIAETVLFNSGRAREYLLVMGFSVGFSIFAESAATMQREQSTVAFKSTQSEVYKATIKAVDVLATNSTLSPTQIKLSHLQASFTEAKQLGKQAAMESIQARILRLEQQIELEQANKVNALQNTITQAKALEYDETNHQAMIRFLAEVLGLSHVVSSALLAFFLILTFKICFHYLGSMRQLNERAIAINTGKISASIEPFRVKALVNESPADNLPKLDSTDLHERVEHISVAGENSDKSSIYASAELAKVGTLIDCPQCGTAFTKANKWHTFCKSSCKDNWHNERNPERLAHAKRKRGEP